jgi:hypothetical protein
MHWIADQILKIFNYVPELFLARDDPHFDVLRWWLVFVLAVILILIVQMVRKALRTDRNPPSA